jgi:hypothetical protein
MLPYGAITRLPGVFLTPFDEAPAQGSFIGILSLVRHVCLFLFTFDDTEFNRASVNQRHLDSRPQSLLHVIKSTSSTILRRHSKFKLVSLFVEDGASILVSSLSIMYIGRR